jgi:hypothetical protein
MKILAKIDNGAGGSRATWTGKPERVSEAGGELINLIADEKEKESLREFQRLCEKHGLLPKEPQSATAATRCAIEFNLV